ncbi:MAG TPA: nucleoside-diphosphate sugar epimerase/dehydratase, partial [Anaerolineae bacterium]
DSASLHIYGHTMLVFAVAAEVVKPPVFYFFGLYRRMWRYASTRDLVTIAAATLAGSALATLAVYSLGPAVWTFTSLPRSIPYLDWLVSLVLVGGIRLSVKLVADASLRRYWHAAFGDGAQPAIKRVLVMGAGDAGAMIVREMQANPGVGFLPVGLLDDNPVKLGKTIYGVPVQGTRDDIPRLAEEEQVDEVIIAMPTAPGLAIREIVTLCRAAGVACRTIPGIYELICGQVSISQVREVRIEDLLRRDPVRIDGDQTGHYLADRVVLVTGAGGSIGSELCRQIAQYHPRRLLLLGHGENSIHLSLGELRNRFPQLAVEPLIADVRDPERMTEIIARFRPEVIFHAAAHKHVPLMELNVAEAIMNNVVGIRNLLQAAEAGGVARFVLISSDKAVSPTSVMGATKRIAELLVQDAARRTGRAYVAVRFGNVLGSRGSVVPLFQEQIAAGGPVTVTHPDMQRFFMTIPEAVQLVIEAAAVGEGGEVFVLDMGEPVRVVDLATDLIRLSGLTPGRDIEITFTGVRPAEKLNECLFAEGEAPHPTRYDKILVANGRHAWDSEWLHRRLETLEAAARAGDPAAIYTGIQQLVPEYTIPGSAGPGAEGGGA